ncbi:MAG: hypothetical protein RhofKO_24660 [Rhodothermales bacterium]
MRYAALFSFILLLGLSGCNRGDDDRSAVFVTLLGTDTLAVEQFTYLPDGMEAKVVLRTPRTTVQDYRLTLAPNGNFQRMTMTAAPPGQAPTMERTFELVGDSLRLTQVEDGATTTRMLEGSADMLPFLDMIHWPFDLMLHRAYTSEQDTVIQPLFTGGRTLPFRLTRTGDGTMEARHPSRGPMQVAVDSEGHLLRLDAGATTRKVLVTRLPMMNLDGVAQRFAQRDAAGNSFGDLSGRGETVATVDGATITVDYGQPLRRGRTIWGKLVPYGQVWRTGANRATHFTTTRALQMGNLRVPAGTYTLFTIPAQDGGVLIVSKQTGQGGTSYDEAQDLGRVNASIANLPSPVEAFTIAVLDLPDGGQLQLQWNEKAMVVPFRVVQ